MTPRERVYASIRRQPLDAIPWQFDLTSAAADRLKNHYGTSDLHTALGDHVVYTSAAPYPVHADVTLDPGSVRDEFGAVWRREASDKNYGDWGELVSTPLSEPQLNGYVFPDGTLTGRWGHLPELRKKHPDRFIMVVGSALFERGWSLFGFENYLGHLASDPSLIEEVNEQITNYTVQLTLQLKGMGVDGIRFGDDWGFQHSLMLRPEQWRTLFKKYYRRIYAAAREAGLVVAIHSCGNIIDIIPDCIEIGVEVIHPLQPESMDVAFCQREFGKDVAFWGGLGSQSTIPNGTVAEVKREALNRLQLFNGGGYILAPAGSVPTETPVENIVAIAEVAMQQLH